MGCQSFAWWVVGISAVLFVVGIIVGSMLASAYVENSQERKLYTNTNCLLVNYSSASHTCESCIRDYCFNYQCFDEIFYVSYFIFNGTLVNSTFAIYGKDTQHKQTQIGAYYPCFYATKQEFPVTPLSSNSGIGLNSVEFRESDEAMPESDEAIPESGEAISESDEPVPESDSVHI
ncbi:unnamed protein product [Rotaria magnacalcarata]